LARENSKGREKAILEMDLKIDDLLEKKNQGVDQLDMEYGTFRFTPSTFIERPSTNSSFSSPV
jgi:hypothetical protein